MSLVSNAVKFSPPGLPATIRVSGDDASIEISVSDRGPGIAPGDLPGLFEEGPATGDASRDRPSAGLGLYLARSLTEPHGGRITVTSRPGEGSRFTIILPRARDRRMLRAT
jgi:two-component system, OmpR family, sensor histidine kinase KdpD